MTCRLPSPCVSSVGQAAKDTPHSVVVHRPPSLWLGVILAARVLPSTRVMS
jgi:hypothetical protein